MYDITKQKQIHTHKNIINITKHKHGASLSRGLNKKKSCSLHPSPPPKMSDHTPKNRREKNNNKKQKKSPTKPGKKK